jgi:hypothetical protein
MAAQHALKIRSAQHSAQGVIDLIQYLSLAALVEEICLPGQEGRTFILIYEFLLACLGFLPGLRLALCDLLHRSDVLSLVCHQQPEQAHDGHE